MKRVMLVFGTRPEAIKMAPVVRSLQQSPHHDPCVVVTAQHREMLDQVLDLFGIAPDHDLDLITPRQGLAALTSRALESLSPIMEQERPDIVLVQGDTTTTMVGALAAFYAGIPVGHLEAGLRTGDPTNPFPEEMNRRVTTRLASLHLAATPLAADNLVREGVARPDIVVTGNTVIDALLWAVKQERPVTDPLLDRAEAHHGPVVLVTTHRRESWGQPIHRIGVAVAELGRRFPSALFILPMHRNPAVREVLLPALGDVPNVVTGEPADYWTFARLMRRATLLLSDSGGVQEEGPSLGKPVLVLRDNTERPEAVTAGAARLVGTSTERIVAAVETMLTDPSAYAAMANAINPYGDGHAAHRTVLAVDRFLDGSGHVDEFDYRGEPALDGTEQVVA
jgi:UDP-N-acetylglucosamine 2-epimerase (non-hydrolysing)